MLVRFHQLMLQAAASGAATGNCNSRERANDNGEVETTSDRSSVDKGSSSTKIGVFALKNKKLFKLSLTPIKLFGYYPGPVHAITGIA